MSDVLIKGTGFKKPKSCFTHGGVYCPFHVESFNGKYHACTLTGSEVKCNRLSKDCPLVEVKPHGDLIARDALKGSIEGRILAGQGVNIFSEIDNAPTVLEASYE